MGSPGVALGPVGPNLLRPARSGPSRLRTGLGKPREWMRSTGPRLVVVLEGRDCATYTLFVLIGPHNAADVNEDVITQQTEGLYQAIRPGGIV